MGTDHWDSENEAQKAYDMAESRLIMGDPGGQAAENVKKLVGKGKNMGDHGSRSDGFDHFRERYYAFGAYYGWYEPNYENLEVWDRRDWVAFVSYMDEHGSWPDEIRKEKASDDFYDLIGKAFLFLFVGVVAMCLLFIVFGFIIFAAGSLTILASFDPLSVPKVV